MPLLDHFHAPLFPRRSWENFHYLWTARLTGRLNQRPLPPGFLAECNIHIGISVAPDVAAFEEDADSRNGANGAVATAVWAPPKPPLVVPIDFTDLEVFEIRVYDENRARTLVAAVEIVSPGNKDRPEERRVFVNKCANYLREGVALVVVDIVTARHHNFHAALMEVFRAGEPSATAITSDLYAVAYRTDTVSKHSQLEAWPHELTLGAPLPTLPLWLAGNLAVPLDLETGYREACRDAGIS